jgi:acetoin utilization protein AcuB
VGCSLALAVQGHEVMTRVIPAVRHYMTASPYSIGADQSLTQAHALMREHSIRHLPVLEGERLVGVVTERDLSQLEALSGTNPKEMLVTDAMSLWTYAAKADTPLDLVVDEMASRKLGCAVVIEQARVVGIFTTVDVCTALYELLHGRLRS